jgi:glycosyltransferase involved in cell wall biosynthesis
MKATANRPLRVLHVLDSLAPGGLENGVVNTARRLHGRGFDIHAACLRFRGDFAERMPDPGKVVVLGKNAGFSPGAVRRLRTHLRATGADLLHSHNLGTLIYAAAATFGGRTIPIVHGEHGQLQPQDLTPKRLLQRRLLFRLCRRLHAVSAGLRDHLRDHGLDSGGRILATPNGVDSLRFRMAADAAAAKAALGFQPDDLVVGIVGRLVALKRHRLLFEALEKLAGELPTLRLLVVGDGGAERDELVAAMRAHPQAGRIVWAGHRNDLENCYPAMDLLAAPSEIEGLSNAVLEAMACAVPVLAHQACGNAEVIDRHRSGYLADLRDAAGLANELRAALGDPGELRRRGAEARRIVLERYSMEAMEACYRELYRGAVRA